MQNEPGIPRRCSIFPGRTPHPPRPSRRWGAVAALVALAAVLGIATPEDAPAQALPGPPQNFTATAGDTQVVLTWDAPASAGGAAITSYQYRTAVGATVPESHSWISGTDLEATVPGLTNGTQYAFEVRAKNRNIGGEGPVATATATPMADVTLTWNAREAGLKPSFTVTITFLEAVEDFTLDDISVNAINISDLQPELGSNAFHQWSVPVENFQTISATTYSVKVTPHTRTITLGPAGSRRTIILQPQRARVIIPVNAVQAVDGGTPNRQKRQLIDLILQVNICDRTDQVEEKILSRLMLTDCTSVPSDRLASITTLTLLGVPVTLQDVSVNSLQADDFEGLSGLRTLNLIRVGLTTLPAGVFDQLGSLTRLSLTENMLTALPAGVFDQLSSLTTLYLAGNMLTALPAGVFAELSSLTTMELDRNPLSTLSAGMFTGLSSLTELDLYDIGLSTLPAGVFTGLSSLTRLHLHNQQNKRSGEPEKEGDPPSPGGLAPLPAGVFTGLSSLTWLKLDEPYSPYILRPQILASLNRLNSESSYTPPAVPGAPTGLTATFMDTDSTITLSWMAPTGGESPTSYQILRKADQAAQEVYVEDTYYICTDLVDLTTCAMATTTYIDTTVARDVTYTYEVAALNAGGKGDKSSPATEITPPIIMPDSLGVPQNFSATAGDTRVVLSWTAPASDGGTAITTYQYRYSAGSTVDTSATWTDVPDGADADTDAGNERTVTVTSLTNGTQYAFEVRAVNSGDGPAATTTPIIPTPLTSSDATLSALALSNAADNLDIPLSPDFASGTMIYMASVRNRVDKITIAPTRNNNGARVAYLDGSYMPIPDADTKSGQQVSLEVGANTIEVQVTAEDNIMMKTYTVTVTRAPATGIGPGGRPGGRTGGGGGGSSQDEHGNTPAQATPVTLDPTRTASVPGRLNTAADMDYFSVDVPHAGVLVVETSGPTATVGTVWQDGAELATAASGGVGQNFRLSVRVAPGPVVIAVAGNGQQTGAYTLQVTFLPGYLENPGAASFQSGIGVISGWTCDADEVEIVLNGVPQEAAYGTARLDTEAVCGDSDNGFGLLFNWNLLGDGEHEVVALVDGVELDRATVTVTTLGAEFLRNVTGTCTAADFPTMDETVTLAWQQTQQNFVIVDGMPPTGENRTGRAGVGYLENPGPNSFQSGIGVLSGWVCEGAEVIIELNGAPQPAAYGTERLDTLGACGDTANGFGLLFNWNLLGEGEHEVVAFVDGEELGRATVRVTTLGAEFVRDVEGECTVEDFPMLGETVTLEWQQNSQNFVVTDVE